MFAKLNEAFQDSDDMNFRPDLTNLLGNAYPNLVPTSDALANYAKNNQAAINDLTKDVVNGQYLSSGYDIASRFRPAVPRALKDRQDICRTATIDEAVRMAKPGEKIRCGWIYENDINAIPPKTSTGYLGDKHSPLGLLGTPPAGTYYYEPMDAKKKMDVDLCSKMTSCDDIRSPFFAGKCAWSPEAGRGVPIEQGHQRGNPLYNYDPLIRVNQATIVRTQAECPMRPASGAAAVPRVVTNDDGTTEVLFEPPTPSICDRVDGRMSQECIQRQVYLAGCSPQGTFATALNAARNPNDLLADISMTDAYKLYQQRAPVSLNDTMLRDGRITIEDALANFTGLKQAATSLDTAESALGYAARELCNKSKTLAQFDFCTELTDTQSLAGVPYALDCMQKEFKKVGGIEKGVLYPTQGALTEILASNATWGQYKNAISTLAANARSTDIRVQETALRDLLGVSRESLKPRSIVPSIDGYEIYVSRWRSNDDTIFMGRMFMDPSAGLPIISNSAQIPALMGDTDSSMTIVTNLKPEANQNVQIVAEGGPSNQIQSKVNGAWANQYECNYLTKDGDNFLSVYYGQTAGSQAALRVNYYGCKAPGTKRLVPAKWLKLTQELKAPMLSFEVTDSLQVGMQEYRLPFYFRSMGNYYTEYNKNQLKSVPNEMKHITFHDTTQMWQVNKLVNIRAWNSLTFCFKINENRKAATEGIFAYRFTELSMGLTGNNSVTVFLPDNAQATFANQVGKWYVCCINKSSAEGFSDNKYSVAVYPAEQAMKGVTLNEPSNVFTRTYYRNVPIAPNGSVESNGLFQFGYDTASLVAARMSIAWFRVFDYNLKGDDVTKDANNLWKRNWYVK